MVDLSQTKILVVDDKPENLDILISYLQDFGATILVALDGSEALEVVVENEPDLILLDVMMPGMDGFETCRHLKQDTKFREIPIIFMTALTETSDKVKGFEAGGFDYITKPLQHEEVLVRVKAQLTIRSQQQELARQNEELQLYREHLQELVEERTKELKSSEERFRAIIENTNAGYFFIDQNGLIKNVNQAWLTMHGYASADEVIGKHFSITLVDPDVTRVQEVLDTVLTGETASPGEFKRKNKDGSIGYHTFSINPVQKSGEIVGLEGFFIDITAQKIARIKEHENTELTHALELREKQLQHYALRLTMKNKLLDSLLSEIQKVKTEISTTLTHKTDQIMQQITSHKTEQKDWEAFEQEFNKIYQDFTLRLIRSYPQLSPRQMKICMLLRMHMTSQEVADILYLAPRSVEIYRYRIRKVLKLSTDQNLISFLATI
ncbi:response regulator [candidate division CSSED10-310 bacterium]|uniref:Response regulator n=1 Tax=candidate division CSSED10-310 bacterium TaxID=2855610 RepID=A0ABV6Z3L5_UNCC1